MLKVLPTLYGTASGGKTKIYNIRVDQMTNCARITMEHGYEDGKQASERRDITEGKNLGKSNETTPFDQACSEASSRWQKKLDKGYTKTKAAQAEREGSRDTLLPMLAQTYSKIENGKEKGRKKYIKFPCYVQPKLDGCRCISSSTENVEPYYTSRGGKEFTTLDHLDGLVHEAYYEIGYPLDGEIYTHGVLTFQDTVSAIKKAKDNSAILKYHIYDIVATDLTFEERHKLIKACLENVKDRAIVYVPTYEVQNEAEIIKYHEQFVAEGYEGIIIRNKDGKYVLDHRSNDLQKWKNFIDEEFTIVGGKEATGEDKGTIIFICDVGDGRTFDVRPRGTREQRKEYFNNLNSLINKKLTVRFQEFSDDKIPRFPVGICIRDFE